MNNIVITIEEMIIQLLTKSDKVKRPLDILPNLSYDAVEDIKDALWEMVKEEIDYLGVYLEIEKQRPDSDDEEEEEEENSCTSDSDE